MKTYLKNYKLILTALSPIFIGSGKELNKQEYIQDGKKIYIVDQTKLIGILQKRGLIQRYLNHISNPRCSLRNWLIENDIRDFNTVAAYVLNGVGNIKGSKGGMKGINAFMKNAYNEPYIPGSSLKGLLRTIILWNEVYSSEKGKLSDIRNDAEKNVQQLKYERKKKEIEFIKTKLGKNSDDLEKEYFAKKIEDTDVSTMRGFTVSDSKPLTLNDLTLCEKIDVNEKGIEKRPNLLRECIKPGTVVEFDITIDEQVFGYNIEDIKKMIDNYSIDYFDFVTKHFNYGEDEEMTAFLGGGAGYFSKTVSYALFDEKQAVKFVRDFLSKTTPQNHKHERDYKISPHMQKCTKYNGKMYEMGKCRLEIKEK